MPLLAESGPEVSTRQIATACGIAEGTLFRVFPTKHDLLEATLRASLDPSADIARLRTIDRTLPLDARLRQVVDVLAARSRRVSGLFAALHRPRPGRETAAGEAARDLPGPPDPHADHRHHHPDPPDLHDRQLLTAAVADVLAAGDGADLDPDPATAAAFVRSVVTATLHPILGDALLADPDLLTHLLLKALQKDLT